MSICNVYNVNCMYFKCKILPALGKIAAHCKILVYLFISQSADTPPKLHVKYCHMKRLNDTCSK